MDEQVKSKNSLLALLKSSPSSSSLSYSSFYSSSSCTIENEIHDLSPVRTGSKASHEAEQCRHVAENEAIEDMGMRFFNDIFGHGGIIEWKDVEKRFNLVAWTGNGPEPVISWSEFGFCIGENIYEINLSQHFIYILTSSSQLFQ
jgi:respiratory burst oxidase